MHIKSENNFFQKYFSIDFFKDQFFGLVFVVAMVEKNIRLEIKTFWGAFVLSV